MTTAAAFLEQEIDTVSQHIERLESAIEADGPHADTRGQRLLLQQLCNRRDLLRDLLPHTDDDDHALTEINRRVINAEKAHDLGGTTMNNHWWHTLCEIQILSDVKCRLKQAILNGYRPW